MSSRAAKRGWVQTGSVTSKLVEVAGVDPGRWWRREELVSEVCLRWPGTAEKTVQRSLMRAIHSGLLEAEEPASEGAESGAVKNGEGRSGRVRAVSHSWEYLEEVGGGVEALEIEISRLRRALDESVGRANETGRAATLW